MSRALSSLAILFLAMASSALAQEGPFNQSDLSPLQRWERLKPEEQERMRGRFERWGRLSEEQREEYQRRSEERKRVSKEALSFLRPEERASFELLDGETKQGVLRELTHMKLLERGHRLRGMFPKECRERLDSAGAEGRKAILDQFRREDLHKAGERALKEFAKDLGLSEAEVENIRNMKPERRHEELLGLKRRVVELGRQADGSSTVLAEGEWERIKGLPPREFAREWFNHRERADRKEGDKLKRQLHELLTPTLEELVKTSRAPESERRKTLGALVRKRVESFLATASDVPTELVETISELSDHEVITRLHRYLRSPRGERPGDGRRRGEGGGRRERGEGAGERPKPGNRGGPGGPPPHPKGGPAPRPEGAPPQPRGGPRGPGRRA